MNKRLQVIGGGRMGQALLGGLIASRWGEPRELHVVEPSAEQRDLLHSALPGIATGDSPLPGVDALIAVKPNIVPAALKALAEAGVSRVLSIAAGVRIAALEDSLPSGAVVVRCMPNTPALVGAGMSAIAGGTSASTSDLDWARGILGSVGRVVEVSEHDLDAVTGVSGSGPAYVFHLAESMVAAAIEQGLSPDVADILVRQTILGSAMLLSESGEDPGVLRANVTSPGGTTAAGLAVFAEAEFPQVMADVIRAATDRSRELGSA